MTRFRLVHLHRIPEKFARSPFDGNVYKERSRTPYTWWTVPGTYPRCEEAETRYRGGSTDGSVDEVARTLRSPRSVIQFDYSFSESERQVYMDRLVPAVAKERGY